MKKSLKAALAAGAGATLLLGGAGTLAYWSDTGTATGATFNSGHLKLDPATCSGWKIDGNVDLTTQLVVPGDTLTQTCTFTVDAAGAHLSASLDVSTPTYTASNGLVTELVTTAAYEKNTSTISSFPTTVTDNDVIKATITVELPTTATNVSNSATGLAATLNNITVTATQAHAVPSS